MKKVIFIILTIILSIILLQLGIDKYHKYDIKKKEAKYGKFVPLASLNYIHNSGDLIKLSNDKLMIISGNDTTEIYDYKTNTVSTFDFPNNLMPSGKGILLQDNNLLLINACDKNKSPCEYNSDYSNNLIIYDMKNNKIKNQLNLEYLDDFTIKDYLILKDGRVLIASEKEPALKIAIYNPKNNTIFYSKNEIILYNRNIGINCYHHNPKMFQVNDDEIVIFADESTISKYNIKTDIVTRLKASNVFKSSSYTKIGDKILIIGIYDAAYGHNWHDFNLLYDIKKERIVYTVPPLPIKESYLFGSSIQLHHSTIEITPNTILITGGQHGDCHPFCGMTREALIFDMSTNKFTKIQDMNSSHTYHKSIHMNDGNILLIGGSGEKRIDSYTIVYPIELYKPAGRSYNIFK